MKKLPVPTPGVYPGTPMDEYGAWDAASSGRLSRLMKSPAHMRAYIDGETKDTPALILGRAIHCAVLEPDDFVARHPVACQCEATTGKGTRCTNPGLLIHRDIGWVCGVHAKDGGAVAPAGTVLSPADRDVCLGIRDSVWACRAAAGLISGPGQVELSMVWEDRGTGVPVKARWDRHSPEIAGGAIVDVKSTVDASRTAFERTIYQRGYHRQAATYLMGARARHLPACHFSVIAVEKEPPYAVAVYRITEGVADIAEDQVRALLRLYGACAREGVFEGYPDQVQDVSIPDWAWKAMDEETRRITDAVHDFNERTEAA